MIPLEIGALAVLIVFYLIGFIAIFFTTFGTFIILLGAVLYSWMTGFAVLDFGTLFIIFILYVFGEIAEFLFTALGAKKFGASNWAVAGAIAGGIAGALLGTLALGVGVIFGTFLGIFAGAFLVEWIVRKDFWRSVKAGAGGVLGRIGSIAVKMIIAIIILVLMFTRISGMGG